MSKMVQITGKHKKPKKMEEPAIINREDVEAMDVRRRKFLEPSCLSGSSVSRQFEVS